MTERIIVLLQDEGMLDPAAQLRTRLGLKAGDLMDVNELNGAIPVLSPRRAQDRTPPDPMVDDPQFQSKLKSMQDMLENL